MCFHGNSHRLYWLGLVTPKTGQKRKEYCPLLGIPEGVVCNWEALQLLVASDVAASAPGQEGEAGGQQEAGTHLLV